MKRLSTSTVLFAVLIANSFITGNAARAQAGGTSSATLEFTYSQLFPEKAAILRQRLRNRRESLEVGIREARRRGDYREANRLITEGRRSMQTAISNVKASYPPTTVIMFGSGDRDALKQLIIDIRSGRKRYGNTYYIRDNGGNSSGQTPKPNVTRPRNGGSQKPAKPQPKNPNAPNFGGLIGGGSYPNVTLPGNGGQSLYGVEF